MANFYKKSQVADDAAVRVGGKEKADGILAPGGEIAGEKNFGTRKEKYGAEVVGAKERKVDISWLVRGKKKSSQLGRSMIEMLGVLAIIGVLSIAGIAGYTKAMEKWRINKAVQQIATAVTNIKTKFINEKNYDGIGYPYEGSNAAHLLSLGIISSDMISDKMVYGNDIIGSQIVSAFHSAMWINADDPGDGGRGFTISMSGLHRDECIALASNDWLELGATSITLNGDDADTANYSGYCYNLGRDGISGDQVWGCPNGETVPIPIPAHIATQACAHCNEYKYGCSFLLGFLG